MHDTSRTGRTVYVEPAVRFSPFFHLLLLSYFRAPSSIIFRTFLTFGLDCEMYLLFSYLSYSLLLSLSLSFCLQAVVESTNELTEAKLALRREELRLLAERGKVEALGGRLGPRRPAMVAHQVQHDHQPARRLASRWLAHLGRLGNDGHRNGLCLRGLRLRFCSGL